MQKVWMQRSEQVLFEQFAVIDMGHFWEKNSVWSLQSNNKHNNLFRPATADSRFRFWKTWLVEQIEADEKEPHIVKEKKGQRRYQNEVAFKVNTVLHLSIYLPLITSRQDWRWYVMARKEK